jgi:hypothetical protein
MNANTLWLSAAAAVLFTACQSPTTPQVWPGTSPGIRAQLGTVGVQVDYPNSRQFVFEVPETRGDSAHDLSGMAAAHNIASAGGAGAGAIFVLALVPVSAAGGAIYGSVAGVSKTKLHDALNRMTNALRAADLIAHLPEQIIEQARAQDFQATDARGHGATFNTRLKLRVVTQHLVRVNESPNSDLRLHYVVEAQVQGVDGAPLYNTHVAAISSRRKFAEWAAHDGVTLRRESQRMMQKMVSQIVARVFRGEDSE